MLKKLKCALNRHGKPKRERLLYFSSGLMQTIMYCPHCAKNLSGEIGPIPPDLLAQIMELGFGIEVNSFDDTLKQLIKDAQPREMGSKDLIN